MFRAAMRWPDSAQLLSLEGAGLGNLVSSLTMCAALCVSVRVLRNQDVQRLIEQPVDEGDVLEGGVHLGRVLYHLSVYQQFSETDTESVPAYFEVEGRITPVDQLNLTELHRRRAELKLRLADGRVLDFTMANETGAIRSTARGLYRQ